MLITRFVVKSLSVVILLLAISTLTPKLLGQELSSRLHRLVIIRKIRNFILKMKNQLQK